MQKYSKLYREYHASKTPPVVAAAATTPPQSSPRFFKNGFAPKKRGFLMRKLFNAIDPPPKIVTNKR